MVRRRLVGWTLLLGWVVVLVGTFVTGERASTLAQLEADVAAGRVDEVRIVGGLSRDGRGFSVVEAHWEPGLIGYSTRVVEARPAGVHVPRTTRERASARIDEDLGERLQASDPELRVVRGSLQDGASGDYLGWHVAGWVAWGGLLMWAATVGRLAYGPPPSRATRWAWFWLVLLVPVGPVAYLLLGGPVTGSSHRETSKRLTGGWAFVIMLLLSPMVAAGAA